MILSNKINGVPYGIRTRVAAVKGRCPRPLDERDRGEGVIRRESEGRQAGYERKNKFMSFGD